MFQELTMEKLNVDWTITKVSILYTQYMPVKIISFRYTFSLLK